MQEMMWRDSTASVSGGKGTSFDRGTGRYEKKSKPSRTKKRVTPEDDYDRLAERIWRRGRGKIKNKADFISVYETYMNDSNVKGNAGIRESVFDRVQAKHKVSSSIVTKKERVDAFREVARKPGSAEFEFLGLSRGRRVYARRTVLVRGGRQRVTYRDKKGRFVSVK